MPLTSGERRVLVARIDAMRRELTDLDERLSRVATAVEAPASPEDQAGGRLPLGG
jgi:hypothetical protein